MDFFELIKEKKLYILIISVILNILLLFTSGYFIYANLNYECKTEEITVLDSNTSSEELTDTFYVDIKGAVKNPGVYAVTNKNIINDLISLAGGFTKKAYTKNINLSKKLSSEMVIYVYTESEYENLNTKEVVDTSSCQCPTYDISNCIQNGSSEIVTDSSSSNSNINTSTTTDTSESTTNTLININTATLNELMTLSGIGESKAQAIIEYRTKTLFTSIEDIKNVSGIGDSAFEKIKDYITV